MATLQFLTLYKVLCINLCHLAARSCSDLSVFIHLETFFIACEISPHILYEHNSSQARPRIYKKTASERQKKRSVSVETSVSEFA